MSKKYPNDEASMPDEYVEMMRHYIPGLPIQAVRGAWKHNATPLEVMRHLDRIRGKK